MKLGEYIASLQSLLLEHGPDVEVCGYNFNGHCTPATNPQVAHRKINKGRESSPRFWYSGMDDDRKGEAVIRV